MPISLLYEKEGLLSSPLVGQKSNFINKSISTFVAYANNMSHRDTGISMGSNTVRSVSMSIYKSPVCSCITCRKETSAKGLHTHFERNHGSQEQKDKYSNGYNGRYQDESYRKAVSAGVQKSLSPKETVVVTCLWCAEDIVFNRNVGSDFIRKFCSASCSAKYNNKTRAESGWVSPYVWDDEARKRASDKSKECWKNDDYAARVLSSTNSTRFTSKTEVLIRTHFIEKYPDDGWTFGGIVRVDGVGISRDLYSNKLKICFEYDGIWHFKDIYGQLEDKQKKDALLEKWCIDNGYSLVRLDENKYCSTSIEQLEQIFYTIEQPSIIKLGDRY